MEFGTPAVPESFSVLSQQGIMKVILYVNFSRFSPFTTLNFFYLSMRLNMEISQNILHLESHFSRSFRSLGPTVIDRLPITSYGDAENARQENAGLENAAPDCNGGKCRTGK